MLLTNCYCTLAELKSRTAIPDTVDDTNLKAVLESVSRQIDRYCDRRFFVETRTRYYMPDCATRLDVDDLLSVSTSGLTTDDDGDRTYENTWATTDYDLEPVNAPYESPARPYRYLTVTPNGDYTFPTGLAKSVKIVGSWGFYQYLQSLDVLGAAITSTTATTFTATSGTGYSPGQTILIGTEQMHVQSVSGTTITVTRGANGTTAATALNAAVVYAYSYPMVNEACLLQCARIFARRNSPFGIAGSSELGTLMVLPKLDTDVGMMLDPLRSWRGF